MTKLKILRGVPASGKSTAAMEYVKFGWARVNRDDIRFSMYGKYWGNGINEDAVTDVENAMIESNLRAGRNTVVDATNLRNKALKAKISIASKYGATVGFQDFPISEAEAQSRDSKRARYVGPKVISGFFYRYKIDPLTGVLKPPPEPMPEFKRYVPDTSLPSAYIVDTDGTVADSVGVRNPYDTTKYAEDKERLHVSEAVRALSDHHTVIALSGRSEEFREVTEEWWTNREIPFDKFFMRGAGDSRMDAIVKYELFMTNIAPHYNVRGAFDDRPQVLRMWDTIGLPTFDVGEGREF